MSHPAQATVRPRHRFAIAAGLLLAMTACDGPSTTESPGSGVIPVGTVLQDVAAPGEYTNVYVHAHQDDWQLFMGERSHASLGTASNVVFIYTTAGDENRDVAYWSTREVAAQTAVDSLMRDNGPWTCGTQTINAHPIRRCTKGKTVSYFLRLPDGGMSGEGWGTRGSLGFLRDGHVTTLTTRDNSTIYTSWADVHTTLRGIIDHESGGQSAPFVEVHAPETDRVLNPRDHPDHLATGDLIRAAAASRSWNLTWYVDYDIRNRAVNLSQAAHDIKQRAFYGYDYVMSRAGYGASRFEPEYNAWLWRSYSRSEVSVPTPPPAAPSGLEATPLSSSSVSLAWTDNATNESGYRVERAPDAGGTAGAYAEIAALPADATTYASTGLSATTPYWFRVTAYSTAGTSGPSNAVRAVTLAPPAAPTGLQATAMSSRRIDLAWVDVATSEAGYVVERAPDVASAPGTFATIATLAAGATSHSDSSLAGGTRYWYRVRAVSGADVSAYAGPVVAVTLVAPAAPTGLAASATGSDRIQLTWTDNAADETGYAVERAPDTGGAAGTWAPIAALGPDATGFLNTGLTAGTRYWYRVRAIRNLDASAYSAAASATTVIAAPTAPEALTAQAVSAARIDLAWTDRSTTEAGFHVERAPDAGGAPGTYTRIASVGANVTAFSTTSLDASTRYWFRVQAHNAGGTSAFTAPASATTFAPPTSRVDFYVHAHQDDWQLFMGDRADLSMQSAAKVVFVYTTAGDENQSTAFWTTRELAAQTAVDSLFRSGGTWTCATQTVNGHPLRRCVRGKAVAYYLRLPDGGMSGEGFSGRGSLWFLKLGDVSTLTARDGSTTYASWADLRATVLGLIDLEAGTAAVEVHAPDGDRSRNTGDHPDHSMTGDLVREAAAARTWGMTYYLDYVTRYMSVNLTQQQHDVKQRTFWGYDYTMSRAGFGAARFEPEYNAWLWRTYSR